MDSITREMTAPRVRYKSIVHLIRHRLHIGRRHQKRDNTGTDEPLQVDTNSITLEAIAPDKASTSGSCQSPSTSPGTPSHGYGLGFSSETLIPVPAVYDDPFVCVTADGCIHVRNYYYFNPKAEFQTPTSVYDQSQIKQNRRILVRNSRTLWIGDSDEENCEAEKPKSWGLTRSGIWWASHLNRETSANTLFNVVIDDGSPIKSGFSVVSANAFFSALCQLGLPSSCFVRKCLPAAPLGAIDLPFIDEQDPDDDSSAL